MIFMFPKSYAAHIKRIYLLLAIVFVIYGFNTVLEDSASFSIENIFFTSYLEFFLAVALSLSSYLLRTIRWLYFILRYKQEYQSKYFHSLVYLSGFAFTITPGKTGELVRGIYLKPLGIPLTYTTACFISERTCDLFVVGLLASLVLFSLDMQALPLFFIIILSFFYISIYNVERIPFFKSKNNLRVLFQNIKDNLKVKKLFTPLYLTATAWIFQGLVLVVFANYLEVDISSTMLISIYCSGLIIGALSLMPSGIGATELGILFLLTQLGVSENDAILLSIGSRAFTLLPALILGLLCSLILSIKKRTRQLHSFK